MCSSVKTYVAARVLQKAERNHLSIAELDGERHRFLLRLFEIVTEMAKRFWSSMWQKWERYGGANSGQC